MPDHESRCPSCGTWHTIQLGAKKAIPGEASCSQCGCYLVKEIRPKNSPKSSNRTLEAFFEK